MYVPRFNAVEDPDKLYAMVVGIGSAELVTGGPDGYPQASRLPILWDRQDGRLVFHMARANPHWRSLGDDEPGTPALAVVTDAEAYVSPAWYATKAENGRVVPTWNYSAVHLTGRARRHEDPAWLLDAVERLTDLHETRRERPWSVSDAPAGFVDKQLHAIVGVEMRVERVEGKAKLSQNRSDADRAGVVAGLRDEGGGREHLVADQVERAAPRR